MPLVARSIPAEIRASLAAPLERLAGLDPFTLLAKSNAAIDELHNAQARIGAMRRRAVRQLRAEGYTLREIAEPLGVKPQRIHQPQPQPASARHQVSQQDEGRGDEEAHTIGARLEDPCRREGRLPRPRRGLCRDRHRDQRAGRSVVTVYVCPTCGRTYKSPVQLLDPPTCSGVGTSRRPKHSPKLMQPKAAVSNREQEKQPQ